MNRTADAVNSVSSFLADEAIHGAKGVNQFFKSLPSSDVNSSQSELPIDAIVFCASSVLSLADTVFHAFKRESDETGQGQIVVDLNGRNTVLVLCGGIGHSTPFLYEAVAKHPIYNEIADQVQGKPEARVLQMIAERWFGMRVFDAGSNGATVLPGDRNKLLVVVEDQSTNCGANASESRKVLQACGVSSPRSVVVVQDPTMSRRTVATFEKTYSGSEGKKPRVVSWPTFTPKVHVQSEHVESAHGDPLAQLRYLNRDGQSMGIDGLWSMRRFVDLLLGEIPRLRDDANGYGPNGKGFLVHVDIPEEVEEAWKFLDKSLGASGRDR